MPVTPVAVDPAIAPVTIASSPRRHLPLAMGGSWYSGHGPDAGAALAGAFEAAWDAGLRHFDTATGYSKGESERLLGRFLKGRRDGIFLASKSNPAELTAESMLADIEASRQRLDTDFIDLYYIHWPRAGRDMRPVMEGLERARADGRIGAIGVSNFSVEQMRQIQEVGRIDACQLGYNLIWRHAEQDVIPFCRDNGISLIAYSALAHGILTGKFGRELNLPEGDQRHTIVPFMPDVWPHVHPVVEQFKAVAAERDRPLMHLALRWLLTRPGIDGVVAGANTAEQVRANAEALSGAIPQEAFDRLTALSDTLTPHIPTERNLFSHYP